MIDEYAPWLAFVGSLFTNVAQFVMRRRKDAATIENLDAQTIKSLMEATHSANERAMAAWERCDVLDERLRATEAKLEECENHSVELERLLASSTSTTTTGLRELADKLEGSRKKG